jgi:hypothetical protein
VGIGASVGDWSVTLDVTNKNATDAVSAENQFNDPPAAGRNLVMTRVTVIYNGDGQERPSFDLQFQFAGSAGNTFGSGTSDYCGVIPDSLTNVGEMFAGATGSGNICVSVDAAQIEGGAWYVQELLNMSDEDPVFFALA